MTSGLTVWGRRSAFNVQKVLWLVDELTLPHRHVPAGGAHGGLDQQDFLAMNPHGRVPVIDDGGTIVWESHAILRYLAARHGAEALWPADLAERSRIDRWMDWSQTTLQPAFMDLFWGFYRTPQALRSHPAIASALERCAIHYGLLDRWLADRPYLAGDRFTLADIPAGTSLHRYLTLEVERPDLPRVRGWYDRLCQHPAYRAHVAVPYDELRGRMDY
jgi:glutathione S-transferase